MTSKLYGVCDSKGGPLRLHLQRGNAVTSLVLMGCSMTCRLLLRWWGIRGMRTSILDQIKRSL